MRPWYLNGRPLHRPMGGVRRYTEEVARHLDGCTVIQPTSARHPWSARAWEQTTLARNADDGVLLNTAHSGPIRHPRQVNVIHDLLALQQPRSVHPAFAALERWQLPRMARRANHVVTVSTAVADQICQEFGVAASTISLAPPGISEAFQIGDKHRARQELGLSEGPVVVALLDPTPRKNSHQTAALLRDLQRERPELQVVVAGAMAPAPFAGHDALPTNERHGFLNLGAASDACLAKAYQAADVFVSLPQAEGFGLQAVEAAACGASVVTTPVPSICEFAPEAARVVANATEARSEVLSLLDNPRQSAELVLAGAESLGDLRWDKTAATLEALLDSAGRY